MNWHKRVFYCTSVHHSGLQMSLKRNGHWMGLTQACLVLHECASLVRWCINICEGGIGMAFRNFSGANDALYLIQIKEMTLHIMLSPSDLAHYADLHSYKKLELKARLKTQSSQRSPNRYSLFKFNLGIHYVIGMWLKRIGYHCKCNLMSLQTDGMLWNRFCTCKHLEQC